MFDAGVCEIYEKEITKSPTGKAVTVLRRYAPYYYDEINFTVTEYYAARQAEVNAARRVRVRQDRSISPERHVMVIDGRQYAIGRFFHSTGRGERITDLTLEEVLTPYDYA